MNSFNPDSIAMLNDALLPLARQFIEEMGVTESGAFNFYNVRVERNDLTSDYDVALTRKFVEESIDCSQIHEIGCGWGQLPMLLALNGIASAGVDIDARRAKTAQLLFERFKESFPNAAPTRFIHGGFPLEEGKLPPKDALVLFTNLVFTCGPEVQSAVLNEVKKYKSAIIDVDRLFEKRANSQEREITFSLLRDNGFTRTELFLDLGPSGCYHRLYW